MSARTTPMPGDIHRTIGLRDLANPAVVVEGDMLNWVRQGVLQSPGHVADDMPALLHSVDVVVLPR